MQGKLGLLGMFAVGAAALVAAVFFLSDNANRSSATAAYSVPGKPNMTPEVAHQLFYQVAPALLTVVFQAYENTDENDVYDTLKTVTDGDALDQLYAERNEPLATGGLEERDRKIHEVSLLDTKAVRVGTTLEIAGSWQVVGTVADTEHTHVRGNTYTANLIVKPVQGAWRITDFDLLEVSQDAAGETFIVPQQGG